MYGLHVNRYHAAAAGAAASRPSIADHIRAAVAEARDVSGFSVGAAAVFVGGPKSRSITLGPEERTGLRELVASTGIRVIAHSSYAAQPWRGDAGAAQYIRDELRVCAEAGIEGLVVHAPKLPIAEVVRYAGGLTSAAAAAPRLYLETPAVTPAETYYETPEKLRALFTALREVPGRFGLCVDTAHIWTSGVDLRSYDAAARWLGRLEEVADVIPHEAVMLHLNDSLRARGVGPDAHAGLAAGRIWEEYRDDLRRSGLAAFVDYAERHGTPVILERKPKEALPADYAVLRRLGVGAAAP
jgi:endonuclease IV